MGGAGREMVCQGLSSRSRVAEVARRPTLLRLAALVLNLAIVGWLAYRKRLFIDV